MWELTEELKQLLDKAGEALGQIFREQLKEHLELKAQGLRGGLHDSGSAYELTPAINALEVDLVRKPAHTGKWQQTQETRFDAIKGFIDAAKATNISDNDITLFLGN